MSRRWAVIIAVMVAVAIVSTCAFATEAKNITWGNYLLFRIRCATGGFTIAQRANAIQLRANDILTGGKSELTNVEVRLIGYDAAIYIDNNLFVTVTTCDAAANGNTSTVALANLWAERLKAIYPKVAPTKPGVGQPERLENSGDSSSK